MLGWELPPHNSGGLGQACLDLCKSLASQNVDIEFVLPYYPDDSINFMKVTSAFWDESIKENTILGSYSSADYRMYVNHLDSNKSFEDFVIQHIQEKQYDIIHAHDWLTFRAAMRLKEKTNLPVILHVHSIEADRSGGESGNQLVREIEEYSLNMADKVVAVSEHTKKMIISEYGVPADTIEVVHNSIDVDDIIPLSGQNSYRYIDLMKNNGYRVVVSFGRLTIQKGIPNLIQAISKVVKYRPKTLLLIIGNGDQYFELIKLAADLGISENVIFADFQRGKKLRDGISIGDLFVMPSISEPFGLSALESIGYGTPALVSKQSGVSEVIKNILKVDFWDIDEMANIITIALNNSELTENLETSALNELNNLSWSQSAKKIIKLYDLQLGGAY